MKNFATLVVCFVLINCTFLNAQTLDTVSIGAGYSQQVWYKLEMDKEVKSAAGNWDLGFSTRINRDAAIWVNPNASLYRAVAPASAWANLVVDTLALTPEKQQFNADSVWYTGAFNYTGDNVFNYGWGTYNIITHNVIGDSIYIMKTLSGAWKKIFIEKLSYDTSYFFKYADLNGANEKRFELKKKDFSGKYFGYFSFSTDNIVNREPLSKDWDLNFWRYIGLTPDGTGKLQNYPLTGIMSSDEVKVAKIKRDTSNDKTDGLNFQTRINVIGADWKNFDQVNNRWTLLDSTAYFVKLANGKIFKLIFTGLGGSANGNMIFTREDIKAITSSSIENPREGVATFGIYPNPATDGGITLVYELGKTNAQDVDIQLINFSGQSVFNKKMPYSEGLQQYILPTLNLNTGLYFARIQWGSKMLTQKVLIH
jgi:hypothetical protein